MVNDKVINKAILNELANYIQHFKMLPVKNIFNLNQTKITSEKKNNCVSRFCSEK
jgi:hypothetical protein